MNIIKTEHLTKQYGKARGISNVNLSVEEGDFFGFIGPNGAGKSTTIRILLGFISPSSGSASLFGKDVTEEKTEILKNIGYIPSEPSFYGSLTVKDILEFSARLRHKDCREEAHRLCRILNLDIGKRIDALSLGNRKKVSIVCALQHKPRLYILDEPTSGLDPLIQRSFYELLEERNRAGATIFLSSHILSEVQAHCKSAAVIRDGNLLTTQRVESLCHTQTKRVSLRGVRDLPFSANIHHTKKSDEGITFLFDGAIKQLLALLEPLPLTDLAITEPSLEEIFFHYYADTRGKN